MKLQKNIISISEACQLTGFSKMAIYMKVHRREIPHYKRGKTLVFKRDELESWMTEYRIATTEEINKKAGISACQ